MAKGRIAPAIARLFALSQMTDAPARKWAKLRPPTRGIGGVSDQSRLTPLALIVVPHFSISRSRNCFR